MPAPLRLNEWLGIPPLRLPILVNNKLLAAEPSYSEGPWLLSLFIPVSDVHALLLPTEYVDCEDYQNGNDDADDDNPRVH